MTRMWCVPPAMLCDHHLYQEHKTLHGYVHHITAENVTVVEQHAAAGNVDTALLSLRHSQLAEAMTERGFNHDSDLHYQDDLGLGHIDLTRNIHDLMRKSDEGKCGDKPCKTRIDIHYRHNPDWKGIWERRVEEGQRRWREA